MIIVLFLFGSCRSSYNNVAYFSNIDQVMSNIDTTQVVDKIKIQPDDDLLIIVSADNQATAAPFNLLPYSVSKSNSEELPSTRNLQTYIVDDDGCISFPQLGKIKVGGLSRMEVKKMLEQELCRYLSNPIVNIKFVNYKYSVIGEVTHPGVYPINNDRISILDAISYAGDLTIQAKRDNVLLIREVDGKKQIHKFDLTDANIINSPNYYIKQNDVIYIEPNKAKKRDSKYSPMDSFNISIISSIIGGMSVITSILIAFIK